MNSNIRNMLTLAAILCTAFAANAQQQENTYSRSAAGKETINTNWNNHWYTITLVSNKATALCVDNKKIADTDLAKYDSLITRIVTQIRLDEAQAEKDRVQADLDRQQADRDQAQADRDRQQAEKDRAHADLDRQQADHDREQANQDQAQAVLDRQQADRDRIQGERDREQGERDRIQGEIDRRQAAEDRENMRRLILLLIDKKLIPDAASLKDLVLTDDELLINGKKTSPEIHQEIKQKYSKWAHLGMSYGSGNGCCTSVHFHSGSVANE